MRDKKNQLKETTQITPSAAPEPADTKQTLTELEAIKWLAQFLAGCPMPPGEVHAPEPYGDLIEAAVANPSDRLLAFEEAIQALPDSQAAQIRRMIFAQGVSEISLTRTEQAPKLASPVTGQTSRIPRLPAEAQLEGDPLAMLQDHWVGQYCAFASKAASMSPMSFHLANALAAGAAAIARRVCLRWSTQSIYPNLYILIVAPSTLYHKTTALNLLRLVLSKAELGELLLPDMQSPESLVMEMGITKPPTFETWPKSEQKQWQDSRRFAGQRLWVLDEAGRLLDAFKRDHTAGLLSLLLSLYDCPEREMVQTIGRGRQAIVNGYLSFVGATTPDAIKAYLRHSRHWSDGLWARFALVGKPEDLPAFQLDTQSYDIPASLIDGLREVAFTRLSPPKMIRNDEGMQVEWPQPIQAELDPEACAAWQRYAKATCYDLLRTNQIDEMLFSPYGRLATTALKVALILAALVPSTDYAPVLIVRHRHWHIAQLIVEQWRAGLHRLIEESLQTGESRTEDRILSLVRAQPQITRRELMRQLHLRRDDLLKTLQWMVSEGLLMERRVGNKSGPATLSYVLGHDVSGKATSRSE